MKERKLMLPILCLLVINSIGMQLTSSEPWDPYNYMDTWIVAMDGTITQV